MSTPVTETAAAAALQIEYWPRSALESQPAGFWRQVLGVVGFDALPALPVDVPLAASMTPVLDGSPELCEIFRAVGEGARVSPGIATHGSVRYRCSDELLFGCVTFADVCDPDDLMRATENAYQEIFDLIDRLPQRHLIRIWNYLPDINLHQLGEERYRQFNSARQAAFRHSGRANLGTVPAACALGSPTGSPLAIYFLSGLRAARMIENPRQTSAYHYPPKFGRHSPIFSRACLWGQGGTNLFISGTASIVGHESIHRGDVAAQTRETVANIEALIQEANRLIGSTRYSFEDLKPKVYVRHREDLPVIRRVLGEVMAPERAVYLQADVCRDDLLVEIEATA